MTAPAYPTKEELKLTLAESNEFIELVMAFAKAKQGKDYSLSDRLRLRLAEWQEVTSDEVWVSFAESGTFVFHPFFEPVWHMWKRLAERDQ